MQALVSQTNTLVWGKSFTHLERVLKATLQMKFSQTKETRKSQAAFVARSESSICKCKIRRSLTYVCRRMTFNLDATNRKGPITDATKLIVEGRTTRNTDTILGMAPLMLVAWQSGNLPYFTPPSVPLLQVLAATSMSASPTSANASTAIASQNTVNPSANGLAQEAKIGIGVGTGCGVLLVCASIGLLVYRRRLRRSHEKVDETQPAGKAEGGGVVPKAELAGDSHVREIDGRQTVAETDGANVRHELEGDWHGYEVRAT